MIKRDTTSLGKCHGKDMTGCMDGEDGWMGGKGSGFSGPSGKTNENSNPEYFE
jgi:hypothetical protein